MSRARTIQADWGWTGDGLVRDLRVAVDASGRVTDLGSADGEPDASLPGKLLLPGFVNAHSHAFQRGLRGKGERFPGGAGNFWTWREAMYELVESLDADGLHRWSLRAFEEMRDAGITSVGEFHYLHHGPGGGADFALDEVVVRAARDAGLRVVLLSAYYRSGGFGAPLEGGQRRFAVASPDAYWRSVDRLSTLAADPHVTVGAAVHSVRAAPPDDVREVLREAGRREIVVHAHVEEQRREIDDCRTAYGRTPMAVFLDARPGHRAFTAVHCTHTAAVDRRRLAEVGGMACLCPLTEANLGDGIADLPGLTADGVAACLGTDSNARISFLEEMRWLEYAQRLRLERRGVVSDAAGDVADRLLACATEHGARSLGLPAGRIAPGCWADFTVIDLQHPSLAGWTDDTLLAAVVFGASDGAVAGTFVGGRYRESRRSGGPS